MTDLEKSQKYNRDQSTVYRVSKQQISGQVVSSIPKPDWVLENYQLGVKISINGNHDTESLLYKVLDFIVEQQINKPK